MPDSHKWLYLGAALAIVVAISLAFIVIPDVIIDTSPFAAPEKAVPPIRAFAFMHLLMGVGLIWTVFAGKRSTLSPRWLLWEGIILILFSLLLMDGAFTYHDHPDLQRTSAVMFAGTGFDFLAGLLALYVRHAVRRLAR